MITDDKIIEIYCSFDDFCKEFVPFWQKSLLVNGKKRIRKSKMTLAEVLTIQVLFQLSDYKNFKAFYLGHVKKHLADDFKDLVSYNRMVELISSSFMPMAVYLKTMGLANCNGISFIDSTPLRVCHNRRIHQHKTFKHMAERGRCSLGWFYGFKLHIVTNDKGGIINFMITKGNVDDRKPLKMKRFLNKLFGKLFGDKGYLSKDLFNNLFSQGIHLVTKFKRNMKSSIVTPLMDAYHLRKRAIIETIFDQLKNIFQIEHTRHRSPVNYFSNIFSALIAYNFTDKKPSLKSDLTDTKQLFLI